ncbi:hypothetical protein D0T50_12335 [Bacteroides sp. 214]|uniref:hypothetical protein n=1 Tax=Bacteroides sp. 214 TaxID=2302935 RepID=UPI0013D435CB|nr:hypothetical protein [Bacteroides sp. 214]NDW13672.1 hypothetical protein [Bacteroides sp. 214]
MCTEKIIGKTIKKILLEWFYFNEQPESIVRLYIEIDSYFDITCSEENVFIREQKDAPINVVCQQFAYKPIEKHVEWLSQSRVVSIKYLVDFQYIKRGVLFVFDNNHNFVFYNEGYANGDNAKFEVDVDLNKILFLISEMP